MPFDLPATAYNNNNPAPNLLCATYRLATGIVGATTISTGWSGGGNCTGAIYEDDNAGALIASVTQPCPILGEVTGTTAPFTLGSGGAYRFCICADTATTDYLGIYGGGGTILPIILDAFSTSVGRSTNTCTSPGAVPPSSTGALIFSGNQIPYIVIE